MLTPQLIDCLNRRHCKQIQALERQHKHLAQLNRLTETMSACVADVSIVGDGAFMFHIVMPGYWAEHIKELGALLHDYGYDQPQWSTSTDAFYCLHHEKANVLTLKPHVTATQVAA